MRAAEMTDELAARTDSYFLKTKAIVGRFGDREATYAVFMRRPVICTPRLAIEFLEKVAAERGTRFAIELNHPEAAWVGAGDEMAELMAYAAAVGSAHAKKVAGAVGFVGCAAEATAHFFGQATGMGTMPHALIGYAGSTVRAAE